MKASMPIKAALICGLSLAITACGGSDETPATAADPTVHELMILSIDPLADDVWAVGNAALDDQAQFDASKITEEQWDSLATAARELQQSSAQMGALDPVVVTHPGVTIADEGEVGGSDSEHVQGNIDANLELFRDLSNSLADHMGEIAAGAQARDAAKVGPLINQLDGVCESCHLEFWYPAQKEMLKHLDEEAQRDAGML